jgi:hypothetical protein
MATTSAEAGSTQRQKSNRDRIVDICSTAAAVLLSIATAYLLVLLHFAT